MENIGIINVKVNNEDKKIATEILKDLGLNMSTAVNMFIKQIIKRDGLPFEVNNPKPSEELLEALEELDYMEKHPNEYKSYHNVREMFEDILSED